MKNFSAKFKIAQRVIVRTTTNFNITCEIIAVKITAQDAWYDIDLDPDDKNNGCIAFDVNESNLAKIK